MTPVTGAQGSTEIALLMGEHWTTLAVIGPMLAALLSLRGSPWAIRTGLTLGAVASSAATVGLWFALHAGGLDGGTGPVVRNLLGGWGAPLGIELRADGLAVVMLAVTACVGVAVSLYSTAYFGDISFLDAGDAPGGRAARFFTPLWLLLWGALNGIYLSDDVFNLYVLLEILGLAAAAIVTLAVTSKSTVAGMRYLIVSLVGSMFFLLGVALLYTFAGTLTLSELAAADLAGPLPVAALALMTVGMAAKTALFPLHGWLPPAHAAAPAPGSAVLSALVVKGSFYIIVRLWVEVYAGGTPSGSLLLGLLGAGAILWGSVMALRQLSLKRLIAYSTVAQLGYLFVMFPLLSSQEVGGWNDDAWAGGMYHALSHALAKAAMFLAAGNMSFAVARDDLRAISGIAHRLPMTFLAFGLGGLALAGVPPSAGFVAKWLLLRAAIAQGAWGWAILLVVGGLLTLAYVLMVLRYAIDQSDPLERIRSVPRRMEWAAMGLAMLAVILGVRGAEVLSLLTGMLPPGSVGAP